MWVEYLIVNFLWETAWLLVTPVRPIYIVDEFIFLFLVLLCKLLWLNPRVLGKHLTIQLLLANAWLLVKSFSPIYLADDFIFLFLVVLKEIRSLGEFKVLFFFRSGVNQENEELGESRIYAQMS